jgi:hypothetical protein
MANEVPCKCLCHNLCVLIQQQEELGIGPDFPKNDRRAAAPSLQLFVSFWPWFRSPRNQERDEASTAVWWMQYPPGKALSGR